jgi:hypothetical protein
VIEENANDAKYHEASLEWRRGRSGPRDRRAGLGANKRPDGPFISRPRAGSFGGSASGPGGESAA